MMPPLASRAWNGHNDGGAGHYFHQDFPGGIESAAIVMDRNYDAPETRFSLEILRSHPQISYEHAVSAAEYSGVPHLPRGVFLAAADRLGIIRSPEANLRIVHRAPQDAPTTLLQQLDRFREQMTDTATMREALLRMQKTVRAALDQ
jgi:hypothetical protein